MKNIGIVCEYNPFHNGHAKQLRAFEHTVCLMSGNFVQRGEPAILDKYTRAKAAVRCGASLVLELPLPCALSSAEGFADGAVEIFSRLGCIDALCFGSENGNAECIMSTAEALLHPEFSAFLHRELDKGVSFPTARLAALRAMGADCGVLERPNDILAVEYCKALVRRNCDIEPLVIRREGDYHGGSEQQNPSASFLRSAEDWRGYMPREALVVQENAPRYTTADGERAWLARLRFMSGQDFQALPFGSEGLWRRVMHACRTENTLQDIVRAVKSKRYTHTRIMRMLLCAYLGLTRELLQTPQPYVRILAFNDDGRQILRTMRKRSTLALLNAGEMPREPLWAETERRAADLYGLFRHGGTAEPQCEKKARIYYDCKEFQEKNEKNACNSQKSVVVYSGIEKI